MAKGPTIFTPEPASGDLQYRTMMSKLEGTLRWRNERPIGDKLWKRGMKFNMGNQWSTDPRQIDPTSDDPRKRITVNRTASAIQDFLPFLLRKDPEFYLQPKREDVGAEESAQLTSTLMNYYWVEGRMQRQARRTVVDGLVIGHGIMKTGYILEGDFDEAANAEKHGKIELRDYVRKDEPFIRRVNPFKFLFDPHAPDRDLESARWAAEIFFMPRQDVFNNDRYTKSVRTGLEKGVHDLITVSAFLTEQEAHKGDAHKMESLATDEARAHDLVVLVEVWDKKFDKYYVYPWGVPKPLIEESWKFPYLDGFPYVKWDFIALNDEPYGLGIPAMTEDQQMELNRVRTAEYNHRRKHSLTKMAVTEGMIDPGELNKLLNNQDEIVTTKGLASQTIQWLHPPALPSDNYRVDQSISQDFRELLGQDQLVSGGALPSRTTAREVEARENIIGLKAEERIQRVDDFIFEVGTQLLQHMQANVATEKVLRIVGEEGSLQWKRLSPDEIKREYDLQVITTSKPKTDPISEQATRMQVFQIVLQQMPFLMQAGFQVNVPELLIWLLESFNMSRQKSNRFIVPGQPQDVMGGGGPGGQQPGPVQPEGDPTSQQIQAQAPPPEAAAMGAMLGG